MYTIIVNQDNVLEKTNVERIMKKSKLVNNMHFLVPLMYNEIDMDGFTAVMEYRLPISKEYHTEELRVESDIYKNDYYEYRLPVDTNLTAEPGEIEIQLTFAKVINDGTGNYTQYVRKTLPTTITITDTASWSDIIPDSALTALDQRIIALSLAAEQIANAASQYSELKADSFVIEGDQLWLTAGGVKIGNPVTINTTGEIKVVQI